MTEKFFGKLLVSKIAGRQISGRGIRHFRMTCRRLQLWSDRRVSRLALRTELAKLAAVNNM